MARSSSKFDRMFDSLINEKPAPATDCAPALARDPAPPQMTTEVEREIQAAVVLFHGGRYAHCLSQVRKVEPVAGDDPRVAALLGACNALVSGRLRPGIERCAELIEQAFYLPDLYCALGVLLVKSRRRAQAYKIFRKGMLVDPQHPALHALVRDMGLRRRPVFRFLHRSHPANRALGMLRAHVAPT